MPEPGRPVIRWPCAADWAAAKNRPKSFLPPTDEVLEGHLTGGTPIGIYPLLKDDACRFLACGFGGDGWALDAGAFLAAAERHDVAAYLERSRSGAGGRPVTVTDPEATRYFMLIAEAAQLVLQAGSIGKGGEVCIHPGKATRARFSLESDLRM